ncbi:ATP-binding cassette domain-containing protein [Xylanimonas allomyrinae]|uniref:ATP-binding cassette domain-containing protein n=1 Tax=Xylanimonas allomyrinae TaxID=2509459 RepID=A0A4V0YED2_9MICO|nr:ATP-binding cassette domain-containing protein [Xylanimonas allomyrinae]QAY63801.1 ATP-binding cassette domain-containing protein [Xylanimonas allomyrinae]
MPAPAIQVTDLRVSFGANDVLRGVSFDVARGEIFALLGANGAGKTTTINVLSTLLPAGGGHAVVAGHDVAGDPAGVRRAISLTGQFAAVDEILTGRENVELVATLRRERAPRQVATDLLARFGLADAADRRAGTYSGGMKRRLDIAMSLVGAPEVVVLDEPTTGLDPAGRLEVWRRVTELADGGTTILLTTQHLDEAEALAGRIAILHDGVIIAEGTLAELKALFPPATVEYVEKQPSLEEIFLAITGTKEGRDVS